MYKKIILLFILSVSIVFAQPSREVAIDAIKANPALLDSSQAKEQMAKFGVSKNEVLDKIGKSTNNKEASSVSKKPINNIDLDNTSDINASNTDLNNTKIITDKDDNIFLNPFEYKDNYTILKDIRKKQATRSKTELKRYGLNFFKNANSIDNNSIPVPSYYILSHGDIVSIWLYGAKNENFNLKIDKKGNINIPKIGPLNVAGKKFLDAESYIKKRLKKSYNNTNIVVDISTYSTIQVNLVGDVVAPGVYNINALSTVKNLLIASRGVKKTGTLRDIIVKRDGEIIQSIDFYKLLQNGDESIGVILKANDTVFIPKAKKIVSIEGEINEPAQFELKPNETLEDLIKYAGGIKSSASKYGFLINRYIQNEKIKTIEVDYKDIKDFKLLNGDKVYVYSIDKVHKESVYIYGNVVRPGEKELTKDRSLKKLFQDEISRLTLSGVFLEDTLFSYALIKSKTKTLEKRVRSFNLSDLLSGKIDILLNNDDEIYIFNKYNSNLAPYVTISGKPIVKAGKYRYYKGVKASDIIKQAGTTEHLKIHNKIKITTYNTDDFMPKITMISAKEAENFTLSAYDEIEVYNYYDQNRIKTFNISGEVNIPKQYSLNKDTTLQQAIEIAGGFTHKAYKEYFEIIRYFIKDGKRDKKLIKVPFEKIDTFLLKEYDEVLVHTIPNWKDRQTVTIKGEVNFPGTYVIENGDKLSDLIKRAGGYTNRAFIEGAVFTRESIKKLQLKRQKQAIAQLKQKAFALSMNPNEIGQGDKKLNLVELNDMIDKISKEAKELAPIGRISIKLKKDLEEFEKTKSNITLQDKDTLTIPSQNDTILIIGEVMNPTAIVYESDSVDYYIKKAGGLTQRADDSSIYVIYADGSAEKVDIGWFSEANVKKGATIVIPQKLVTYSTLQIAKDISSIFYQFALTAAALNAVGAL